MPNIMQQANEIVHKSIYVGYLHAVIACTFVIMAIYPPS